MADQVFQIGSSLYSASQILDKSPLFDEDVIVRNLPNDYGTIVKNYSSGQTLEGSIYSYITSNGDLWWQTIDNNGNINGYFKHNNNIFNESYLRQNGVLTTGEAITTEQKKLEDLSGVNEKGIFDNIAGGFSNLFKGFEASTGAIGKAVPILIWSAVGLTIIIGSIKLYQITQKK